MHVQLNSLAPLGVLLVSLSSTQPALANDDDMTQRRCATVQGDAAQVESNAERRTSMRLRVSTANDVVTIHAPTHLLSAPERVDVDGAELVRTSDGLAVLLDDDDLCSVSHLLVRQDDSLGAELQVIRATDDGLLLFNNDEGLQFWPVDGVDVPDFRMVWHSPFQLVYKQPKKRTASKKKRKKRRKKRRRRGRRRR